MNRDNSAESSGGRGGESVEELLRGVHARLLPVGLVTPEVAGGMRYARVVADELVFAYALDEPTSVRSLTDADVERAGAEEVGRAGRANLMRVPVQHEEISLEGHATLQSVFGDSHFVASKALYLGELARQVTGESLPSAGALVVVPTRHLCAFHPIADGSVVEALNDLAMYALGAYEDGPGRLSPRVYWWRRGGLTSLTVVDEETRTLSLKPPQELLALMKGLVRLDRAGRIATPAAGRPAPDPAELTRTTIGSVARLAEDPAGLGDAFASALALAHVRCTADPEASELVTWDAWATAVRLGSALFAGSESEQWYLGEENTLRLPAAAAAPPADARAWLDALYLALACRAHDRVARLCRVPLETLRQDDTVDAYVLHWVDTLRTYLSGGTGDAVVEKLLATMQASLPETLTHSPDEFVNRVDYQPVALFHRLFTGDHEAFRGALTEALAEHGGYWAQSAAPRARVALGPLAMACLAHDQGFPIDPEGLPHLPRYLVDGKRVEDIS
ncbi:immunity 49 family protein [Streptomyces sp. NRRL F-4474]|uniref:immunity 49 family protein n=1 Tax=Streptomyces sp. NRRL F-4474 TaxID=1463851 RepID=UPI0004C8EE50|nr:immunity 49 family protein [Streptomyces sp. NRRL F-4474]